MSASNPVLYLDGQATTLLQPQTAKSGNTYWTPNVPGKTAAQVSKYGFQVGSDVLANGRNTRFAVEGDSGEALDIVLRPDEDERSKSRGKTDVTLDGVPHIAEVVVNELAPGRFNMKCSVRRAATGLTAGDVFTK